MVSMRAYSPVCAIYYALLTKFPSRITTPLTAHATCVRLLPGHVYSGREK